MKIDSHHHFWIFDPVRDAWIDDSMAVIRKDFTPKELSEPLHSNGFDGCISVQADQSLDETKFLLAFSKEYEFIKGVVGWVDLRSEKVDTQLEEFSSDKNLKGIRHIVQAESDGFMLGKDFQNGISKLEKYNLTYDILIFPHQIKEATRLVDKFPNQVFVVDHLAKPYIKEGNFEGWKKDISDLAKRENVFCKVSGMVTEADLKNWKPEDFNIPLEVITESFGTKRLLYGSDWPVCLLAADYTTQLEITKNYYSNYSNDEQNAIFGLTAMSVYNIK